MCPKFGRHRRGFKKLSRATLLRDGIYCATLGLSLWMVHRSNVHYEGSMEYRLLSGSSFLPSVRVQRVYWLSLRMTCLDTRVKYATCSLSLSLPFSHERSLILRSSTAATFPLPEIFRSIQRESSKPDDRVAHLSTRLKSSDIYAQKAKLRKSLLLQRSK